MGTYVFLPTPTSLVPPPLWMAPIPQTQAARMYFPFLFNPFVPSLPYKTNSTAEEEILPDFQCNICFCRIPTYSELKEHIRYHKKGSYNLFMENAPWIREESNDPNQLAANVSSSILHEKHKKGIDKLMFKPSLKGKKNPNCQRQKKENKPPKVLENPTPGENVQDCLKMKEVDELRNLLLVNPLLSKGDQGYNRVKEADELLNLLLENPSLTKKDQDSHRLEEADKHLNTFLDSSLVDKDQECCSKDKVIEPPTVQLNDSSVDKNNEDDHRMKKVDEPQNKSLENSSPGKTNTLNQKRKIGEPAILFLKDSSLAAKRKDYLKTKTVDGSSPSFLKNSLLANKNKSSIQKITDGNSNSIKLKKPEDESAINTFTIYPCSYCLITFNNRQCLRRHMAEHRDESELTCISCNTKFACLSSLRKHFLMFHCAMKNRRPCPYCSYRCFQSSDLEKHIARKHTRDFRYKCQFCIKGFTTPKELSKHLRCKHHSRVLKY